MTMMTTTPVLLAQMQGAGHGGGMSFGMHWGWWVFWLAVLLILGGALWRFAARPRAPRKTRDSD